MYKGMTAEEIYPLIEDKDTSRTLDKHAYDHDNQDRGSDSGLREGDAGPVTGGRPPRRGAEQQHPDRSEPEPLQPDEHSHKRRS